MKVITKEEEDAHYAAVLRGGLIGGAVGLGIGGLALWGAYRRYPAVRNLTPQFRAYLVSSVGTFGAITWAERHSIAFGKAQDPRNFYKDESQRYAEAEKAAETSTQRALDWARQNRYTIVGGSWVASIGAALAIVGRNKYLTTGQKVVHARVYAQGLTIAVLMLTGLLEVADAKKGKGRWETVMVLDPKDPEHKRMIEKRIHHEEYAGQDLWMDMVAAEEKRMNERKAKAVAEIKEKEKAEKKSESKAPAS